MTTTSCSGGLPQGTSARWTIASHMAMAMYEGHGEEELGTGDLREFGRQLCVRCGCEAPHLPGVPAPAAQPSGAGYGREPVGGADDHAPAAGERRCGPERRSVLQRPGHGASGFLAAPGLRLVAGPLGGWPGLAPRTAAEARAVRQLLRRGAGDLLLGVRLVREDAAKGRESLHLQAPKQGNLWRDTERGRAFREGYRQVPPT